MLAKVGLYERDIFVSGEWRSSHAASFISGCTAMRPAPGTTQSTPPRNIFMWQAIQLAASNKQRPFAAVIADRETGLVAASGTNRVQDHPLWHAEIDAINQLACSSFVITDTPSLYTTAEPCPMCFGAIHWVRKYQCYSPSEPARPTLRAIIYRPFGPVYEKRSSTRSREKYLIKCFC